MCCMILCIGMLISISVCDVSIRLFLMIFGIILVVLVVSSFFRLVLFMVCMIVGSVGLSLCMWCSMCSVDGVFV